MLSSDLLRLQKGVLNEVQLFTTHQNWTASPVLNGGTPSFACSDGSAIVNILIDLPGHALVQITPQTASGTLTLTDTLNNEAMTFEVWTPSQFAGDQEYPEEDSAPLVDVPNNPDQDPNNPLVDASSSGS